MPKMKTRKAAAKRFKAVANGKFKRRRANLRHILEKKATDCKNKAGKTAYVDQADLGRVKTMLPYA